MNTLYYGDNLDILKKYIPDESVDLIYLDPPFNSKADYNILYREPTGEKSSAQITAFEDTWHWTEEAQRVFQEIIETAPVNVVEMMKALKGFIGMNDMMAYLTMMCIRLIELRRVLKDTGSLYLHCDPTASHYLKILLDAIMGKQYFRNEITWKRSSAHNDPSSRFGRISDIIFFYTKTKKNTFNRLYTPYTEKYISSEWVKLPSGRYYKAENMLDPQNRMELYDFMGTSARWRTGPDKMLALWNMPQTEVPGSHGRIKLGRNGKPTKRCRIVFLDEMPGVPLQDFWDDISYIPGGADERLGYPTQKPEALLERIIEASSNDGDIVLDPFCGCGTAVSAAQKLRRKWVGIDVTHLSINLIKGRLKYAFGIEPGRDYKVVGEPQDLNGSRQLATQNRYQFQWWALSLIDARPYGDRKKGADTGIDGFIYFSDEKNEYKKAIVQVKSGSISVKDIRDLGHVIDREKAEIGIFLTLDNPTRNMTTEAIGKGSYRSATWNQDFPRIQILTIGELLAGKKPRIPATLPSHKKARVIGHEQETFQY